MYDSKRDGYTLVFHENDGVEIFELVAVGARIFASTSDGLYEIKASGSRKVTLKDVIDSGPTTGSQPVIDAGNGDEDEFAKLVQRVMKERLGVLSGH